MSTYSVQVRWKEEHEQSFEVEAESEAEAMEKAESLNITSKEGFKEYPEGTYWDHLEQRAVDINGEV